MQVIDITADQQDHKIHFLKKPKVNFAKYWFTAWQFSASFSQDNLFCLSCCPQHIFLFDSPHSFSFYTYTFFSLVHGFLFLSRSADT